MTIQFWLILGVNIVGWAASVIIFIRKQERDRLKFDSEIDKRITLTNDHHENDLRSIRERVERCEKDFHEHEIMNERQFERYYQDMNGKFDLVFSKIDELKNMLFKMAMNGVFKEN